MKLYQLIPKAIASSLRAIQRDPPKDKEHSGLDSKMFHPPRLLYLEGKICLIMPDDSVMTFPSIQDMLKDERVQNILKSENCWQPYRGHYIPHDWLVVTHGSRKLAGRYINNYSV